ncbi:DeoR family transcriptional regulator, partial [Streptomyces sp. TRM76130]|nr:DeoR family transcriptional regulator [Streptomyces sp. TRM76130]
MFAAERRQLILEMVRANGAVSLRELARVVQTSE